MSPKPQQSFLPGDDSGTLPLVFEPGKSAVEGPGVTRWKEGRNGCSAIVTFSPATRPLPRCRPHPVSTTVTGFPTRLSSVSPMFRPRVFFCPAHFRQPEAACWHLRPCKSALPSVPALKRAWVTQEIDRSELLCSHLSLLPQLAGRIALSPTRGDLHHKLLCLGRLHLWHASHTHFQSVGDKVVSGVLPGSDGSGIF